ncbi:hypothetical protein MCOR27_001526 [Pyricularia oryzae]|uniref:chitinase n=1 Tax=Pyricularia grisea TaxID=148305 RepID=A0ABQ8NHG0_PYRGI|nr:hypothetical protein MCOR01_010593 [Pyricularia oryzae]KAI6296576.1 hypothetical protein MCOR33_006847 [Pyricularia grisea]KAH9438397.1 hypothetical protein MCOR02_002031 [Pyricularia oryzae]KAI6262160.1 hypothetical protein MCOR19_001666 [Pyricularia oryzae]KAI6287079.1 hypothetical protein MCOR27_001526 [Pyricularia oryzae]
MLHRLFFLTPLLLRWSVLAAPMPDAVDSALAKRDMICFDAPTRTVTVTVDGNGQPQNTPAPVDPVTHIASIIIPSGTSHASSPAGTAKAQSSQTVIATPSQTSGASNPSPSAANWSGYRSVLYFTNWGIYGANYQPQDLPVDTVTHILYSFANIATDGEVISSDTYSDIDKHYPTDSWNDLGRNAYGCVKQLYLLKKKNRHLKVLLSIGGWTWSPKFAPIAATAAGRNRFATSAVKLLADWGLDGLDIDWEYPTNKNEADNYVLLLKACREALDAYSAKNAQGYKFLLTVATPAGPENYGNMNLEGMDKFVDFWNLMAYDYAGSWDTTTGHQSNLYLDDQNKVATKFSTEKAVQDYFARGIDAAKITLGLPLYGRSFASTGGLGKPFSGLGDGSIERGVWLYKDLPRPGAIVAYDNVAKASYSYDAAKREFVTYDTVDSAREKTRYMKQKGLGGAVFWEASGDRKGDQSLVGTVARGVGLDVLDKSTNLLAYPVSQYDNIRNGMPGV